MPRYTKEDMQDQATTLMEAYGIDDLYGTEDGNYFLPKDKSLATDHNTKNVKGEVFHFTKESQEEGAPVLTEDDKKQAIKDAILEIQALGINDPVEVRQELIKSKFDEALIAEMLQS